MIEVHAALKTGGWPMKSLDLCIRTNYDNKNASILPPCYSLCASTLESLTWEDYWENYNPQYSLPGELELPRFTNLRKLKLISLKILHSSMIDALLQDNICALEVDIDSTSIYTEFFNRGGTIPPPGTFFGKSHWSDSPDDLDSPYQCVKFLQANVQLSKLIEEAPTTALGTELLPLISSS